ASKQPRRWSVSGRLSYEPRSAPSSAARRHPPAPSSNEPGSCRHNQLYLHWCVQQASNLRTHELRKPFAVYSAKMRSPIIELSRSVEAHSRVGKLSAPIGDSRPAGLAADT